MPRRMCILASSLFLFLFTLNYFKEGFWGFEIQKELPPFTESPIQLEEPFNQPYFYIGKGCQAYVFESLDKQYVLKFFKQKHLHDPVFLKKFEFLPILGPFIEEKSARRAERRARLTNSLTLAEQYLKQEGALISIHAASPLPKKVVLFDRLGWQHVIDLHTTPFILQKKATPLSNQIQKLLEKKESEKLLLLLDSLQELLHQCLKVGVVDIDRAFVQNTAYLESEDRAIVMDLGQLKKISELENFHQEVYLKQRATALKEWAKNKSPELLPYLELYQKNHELAHAKETKI